MFVILEAELPSHNTRFYVRIERTADTTSSAPREKKSFFDFTTFTAVDKVRGSVLPESEQL